MTFLSRDPEMQELYYEEIDTFKTMYENVVEQEREWAKYLFSKGSVLGLNEQILIEYVEYIAGLRLKKATRKSGFFYAIWN